MYLNRLWRSGVKKMWGTGGDGTKIASSEPVLKSQQIVRGATVSTFSGFTEIRNKKISGVDFAGAQLRHLRLFEVTLVGCCFDDADLRDLRMWATDIENCTFKNADLRESSFGALLGAKRNSFVNIDFSRADMRQTAWISASLRRCLFKDTSLVGVNFQGSTFSHCTFEGEVHDVIFNRNAFRREDLPANTMDHIDFTKARLRFVDFRNLKLDHVSFPNDSEHLVLTDYHRVLGRAISRLREVDDPIAKRLASFLSNGFKWTIEDQAQGILNMADLRELGESAPQLLRAALLEVASPTSRYPLE
jgi:uncharacterized protein YjbI with pentapeptide repeats